MYWFRCDLTVGRFSAAAVRSNSVQQFFAPDILSVDHGLKRCPATTHFALMGAFGVVMDEPFIKISLKLAYGFIQRFAEHDLIEFLQDGLVESLADTVRPTIDPQDRLLSGLTLG